MDTVASKDGTTIAFDRSGQGPAVILVGGAFQHRVFDPRTAHLAELLAPHFTVYHYDRRGRGDCGDTPPYAVEREIEDLGALIAEAGGSSAAFGMSSGAILTLQAAAAGLPITRLALYEPPFIVGDDRPRPPKDLAVRLADLASSGHRGDAVELFMTQGVGVSAEVVDQMRAMPMWPGFEEVAHTLAYDASIVEDGSLHPERWAHVTIPTLVVDGDASPDWARNSVRALAEALPGAEHRTLGGQTHDVDPDVLAPVLEEFFAG